MTGDIWVLAATAAGIGFVHTVIGPDHYLPFIVIAKARNWRLPRTLLVSFLCGLGRVLSSVVLGIAGLALGIAVTRLEGVEHAGVLAVCPACGRVLGKGTHAADMEARIRAVLESVGAGDPKAGSGPDPGKKRARVKLR